MAAYRRSIELIYLVFLPLTLVIMDLFFVSSPALASAKEYVRVIVGDSVLISDDRSSQRTILTSEDILKRTQSENREILEGIIYKIDLDSSMLTIQDASSGVAKRIAVHPETVFSVAHSLQDLNVNDMVYAVYYHDLAGDMITTHIHLVAREGEGNPYTASGRKREEFISYLISSLTVPEAYVRAYAAYALGNFNDPGVVSELTYALRHDMDQFVRINAARSLAKLKDPSSASDLVAALHARGEAESYHITRALIEIGQSAIEPLIQGLYEADKNTRRASAQALGEIEKGSMSSSDTYTSLAFEPLVDILDDENILVCQAAEDALSAITGQDFGKDADAWRVWFNERRAQ